MTAVDSNVVVRLLTADNPEQAAAARSLFATDSVWIGRTVLLETAWVLGSAYGFEDSAIREAFTRLFGLANVHTEDETSVAIALSLNAQGLDFADAIHLSGRPRDAGFVSFDQAFVRRAKRAGAAAVSVVPRR